jgi:chromosome segregation ATPase
MKKRVVIFSIVSLILATSCFALPTSSPSGLKGMLERVRQRSTVFQREFQQNREEIKKIIEQNQVELRNRIKSKREELKSKIEQLRERLKNQLRERIKNEVKEKIVDRVYQRINELNERMTNHYLNVLEKLEKILERIESRTAKAKLNNLDVSKVEEAINEAKVAIFKAKEAVKNQAEKIYQPPEITDDKTLKTKIGNLRQQLHNDLKSVESLVKQAREAVRKALVLLAQINKVDEFEVPEITPTPQHTS